ncbi:hypothetical protein JW949_04610 [Candidatus Woesearchaeota archaeon]|nr:hypothetical protein [Candidatus Woesearchaeota archaeon]
MQSKDMKKKIEEGWIKVHMIFEMIGSPKEHIEKTLKAYMEDIKVDSEIEFLKENYAEAEPHDEKEKLWSTFVEVDMLVKSLEKLTWLCINFMPASIEITEPKEFKLKDKEVTDWFNDLMAKLHEVSLVTKNMNSENRQLKKNINALIRNCILLTLKEKPKSHKEIGKSIGINSEQLIRFLEVMEKEDRIVKDKNKYHLK